MSSLSRHVWSSYERNNHKMSYLVISAKDLGEFNLRRNCQRCLWIKLHLKPLPYQSFPGIFSTIDAYNKRIVHGYFDRERQLPTWLNSLGPVESYIDPPSYHKFSISDSDVRVTLRGQADGIFKMVDGTYTIVDYKTSKYTVNQDKLMGIYKAQLNGYAYLAERLGMYPVRQLALVYMEPITDHETASLPNVVDSGGFTMQFNATIVPVEIVHDTMIPKLMSKARDIYDTPRVPSFEEGCKNCQASSRFVENLIQSMPPTVNQ